MTLDEIGAMAPRATVYVWSHGHDGSNLTIDQQRETLRSFVDAGWTPKPGDTAPDGQRYGEIGGVEVVLFLDETVTL